MSRRQYSIGAICALSVCFIAVPWSNAQVASTSVTLTFDDLGNLGTVPLTDQYIGQPGGPLFANAYLLGFVNRNYPPYSSPESVEQIGGYYIDITFTNLHYS
jgi:hypothetical protein